MLVSHSGRLFYDDEDEDTGDDSIFKELDNVEEPGISYCDHTCMYS